MSAGLDSIPAHNHIRTRTDLRAALQELYYKLTQSDPKQAFLWKIRFLTSLQTHTHTSASSYPSLQTPERWDLGLYCSHFIQTLSYPLRVELRRKKGGLGETREGWGRNGWGELGQHNIKMSKTNQQTKTNKNKHTHWSICITTLKSSIKTWKDATTETMTMKWRTWWNSEKMNWKNLDSHTMKTWMT